VLAAVPWLWFKPTGPVVPVDEQSAQLLSILPLEGDQEWFGGFSGIELTENGQTIYLASDRGRLLRGTLQREDLALQSITIDESQPIRDHFGEVQEFPFTDAEGLALAPGGRLFVSFEHAQRILYYDALEGASMWPSYTRSWRALIANQGLELVALSADGTLFTIPEGSRNIQEALVYRRKPEGKWEQPFTLPLSDRFLPVGGDFGPDGRLYLLERDFYFPAFRNRIRVMTVTETGFTDIETILETPLLRHGNLEGLAVWRDTDARIRLTMVADDNFLFVQRSELVEYVLRD
jgi:hypothetical protein